MLILVNGAFKSGSTWLRAIIDEMVDYQPIPDSYQNRVYARVLDPIKLMPLVKSVSHHNVNYILKSHLFTQHYRDIALSNKHVVIINIKRDIRDAIVSHYHHMVREKKVKSDFHKYYRNIGRYKAYQLVRYHRVWDVGSRQVYTSSFELLKTEFQSEVERIGKFLGQSLSEHDIERIKFQTSIENLRKKRGEASADEQERFFRKGEIGEWQHYFSDWELNDIARIQTKGLSRIEGLKYYFLFELRPAIKARLKTHLPELHKYIHKKL